MEFRRLRYFAAVAEELHYTRAAARLRVAQPHLSQEVRKLEREIGVELFLRTKRSVALTPAGRVFLQKVRGIFDAQAEAVRAAQRVSRGESGRLAVGFVSAAAYSVMPAAIARFRQTHPDVELALSELNSDEGAEAVRLGQLDLCLLHPPRNLDPTLEAEPMWKEPLVLALPAAHRAAARQFVALASLKDEPWVLWERKIASCLYDAFHEACGAAGFEPRIVQRTVRMATVVSLVASGVGIGFVPATAAQMGIGGVVFRHTAGAQTSVPMAFVRRRRETVPAIAPFIAAVREARGELGVSLAS